MAAQLLVLARTPGFHEKSGKPYCTMLVDVILDRTVGKPVQAVHVHRTNTRVPADVRVDIASTLAALLTAGPEVLARAMAEMAPADRAKALAMLPVDAEPIDPV